IIALQREIVRRTTDLPGIVSVGATTNLPVSHNGNTMWIRVIGKPFNGEHNEVPSREVSASYFAAIGARLVKARFFTEFEDSSKPRVTIINQTLANQYFPNEDPIGRQIAYTEVSLPVMEVVGIVEDIKEGQLDTTIPPVMYVPINQQQDRYFAVVARASQAPESLLVSMVETIRKLDPGIATRNPLLMTDRINDSQSAYMRRSSAWLVSGFAALALVLSVVGLYGVIAYSVSRRKREIGIRIALGAQRSSVYALVLREAGSMTLVGISAGLVCAIPAATMLRQLLFGV